MISWRTVMETRAPEWTILIRLLVGLAHFPCQGAGVRSLGRNTDAINLLKMTELTAEELVDGEIRGDDDYLLAIASASRYAIESIHQAYDLMDEVSMSLLPEGTAA